MKNLARHYSEAAVHRFSSKYAFLKFRNIQRKATVLESLFNKVADLKAHNLIKKRIQHMCFPVNIEKFSRTVFHRTPPVAASYYSL